MPPEPSGLDAPWGVAAYRIVWAPMPGIESAAQGIAHAFAFLFGAVVGSFLNVVVARLPAGESIVHAALALPALPDAHRLVRQRPGPLLAPPAGALPAVPGRPSPSATRSSSSLGRRGRAGRGLPPRALARRARRVRRSRPRSSRSPSSTSTPGSCPTSSPCRCWSPGSALSALGLTSAPSFLGVARRGGGGLALLRRACPSLGEKVLRKEALGLRRRVAARGDRRLGRAWRPAAGGAARLAAGHGGRARTHRDGARAARAGEAAEPPPDGPPPAIPTRTRTGSRPRNAVPFGPFLAAGALEWLWLQGWLASWSRPSRSSGEP